MRDRVKIMLGNEENIIYDAFTREPYILHEEQYI